MAYSDAFKQEALILLAYNKYDYALTAKLLKGRADQNVTVRSLRNWEKNFPKNTVPELLDRTVSRLLSSLPLNIPAKDYGIILGILLDKWLLMKGMPTQRAEGVLRRLDGLTENEWEGVQQEMERILTGKDRRGASVGISENN